LELIYGQRAQLHIANKNGMVVTEVEIPMHVQDTTNNTTP
jgi:filamentous hemagglutinin family protein